jgi:hypothetical protein
MKGGRYAADRKGYVRSSSSPGILVRAQTECTPLRYAVPVLAQAGFVVCKADG